MNLHIKDVQLSVNELDLIIEALDVQMGLVQIHLTSPTPSQQEKARKLEKLLKRMRRVRSPAKRDIGKEVLDGLQEIKGFYTDKTVSSVHVCPPQCDAGGPESDGGHDFSVPFEERDPDTRCTTGGDACSKCGLRNIDFDLMTEP